MSKKTGTFDIQHNGNDFIADVMCNKYCGDCGNTIRDDGEIFCVVIQSRVDEDDEACDEFSGGEPQYR